MSPGPKGERRQGYPVEPPCMWGHGMVVEVVAAELGALVVAVLEVPDGLVAAPDTIDPIPSPNPSAPPATPIPNRILLKRLFIGIHSFWRSVSAASPENFHPCGTSLYFLPRSRAREHLSGHRSSCGLRVEVMTVTP